jgi:tRNA (guanine-N7-)-methyltransferase
MTGGHFHSNISFITPELSVILCSQCAKAELNLRPTHQAAHSQLNLMNDPRHANAKTPDQAIAHPKTIKSYVIRAGRTTTGQAKAFSAYGDQFLIPFQDQPLDAVTAFGGTAAPLILEIGFGMGEATAHIAKVRPTDHFLCCEVHEPGVGALLKRVGEMGIDNIRIVQHDAVQVLEHMLVPDMLDGVHIFFPDPWHKSRHHKRRLIQAPLIKLLASRLKTGGYLHCATDWQPYAEQMLEVLSQEPQLRNTSQAAELNGYAPKPDYRPLTKFENRGLKLGHGVWDLVFTRQPA